MLAAPLRLDPAVGSVGLTAPSPLALVPVLLGRRACAVDAGGLLKRREKML